jgi:hypothetical protein
MKRLTVRLRFVLSSSARVTFVIFGPAPSCSPAGRFTIAGHPGLNSVRFAGRVRGRLLRAGLYTIVPQPTAGATRLPGPRVAVAIDARGVHPAERVPLRNCRPAARAMPLIPATSLLPGAPRHAGVKAAIVTEPPAPGDRPVDSASRESKASASVSPGVGKSWLIITGLLTLLASVTLLGLAAAEPRYAATRFHLVRVLDDHREHVAFIGAAFLAAAAVLFMLTRLTM